MPQGTPEDATITWERIGILAIGAVVGLLIREAWASCKERRARRARLKVLLLVARDEVQFYLTKLQQLEHDLATFLASMQQGGTAQFTPSYTLYPEFLEHQRRLLAEHRLSSQGVVRDLGLCAFELRHIAKRISDARTTQGGLLAASDWAGPHALVETNMPTLKTMLDTIDVLT